MAMINPVSKILFGCGMLALISQVNAFATNPQAKTINLSVQVRHMSCHEDFEMSIAPGESHFFAADGVYSWQKNTITLFDPNNDQELIPISRMAVSSNNIVVELACTDDGDPVNFNLDLPVTIMNQAQVFINASPNMQVNLISEDLSGSPVQVVEFDGGTPLLLSDR